MKTVFMTLALSLIGMTAAQAQDNPAEKHCASIGGEVQIFRCDHGEVGYCRLGDARVEEWTLYRATVGQKHREATDNFMKHPPYIDNDRSQNPEQMAAAYCEQLSGQAETVWDEAGDAYQVCRFKDRSAIEQMTLFLGPNEDRMSRLAQVLHPID